MNKLSKYQQELLNHLKENNTFLHYMGYMGSFNPSPRYFASETMKRFKPMTVDILVDAGYLERYDTVKYSNDHKVRLKGSNNK